MADLPKAANRREQYLAAIAGQQEELPAPANREEMFLATIAGATGITLPTPANRKEQFLAYIAEHGGVTPTPSGDAKVAFLPGHSELGIRSYTGAGYAETMDQSTLNEFLSDESRSGGYRSMVYSMDTGTWFMGDGAIEISDPGEIGIDAMADDDGFTILFGTIGVIDYDLPPQTKPVTSFNDLCFNEETQAYNNGVYPAGVFEVTLTGIEETTIGDKFLFRSSTDIGLEDITIPDGIKTIGDDFLRGSYINGKLQLPNSVETIGDNFLRFSQLQTEFDLPTSIKSIGDRFMSDSGLANTSFTIPATLEHVGAGFLYDFWAAPTINLEASASVFDYGEGVLENTSFAADDESYPIYESGIRIIGTNTAELKAKFPNVADYDNMIFRNIL